MHPVPRPAEGYFRQHVPIVLCGKPAEVRIRRDQASLFFHAPNGWMVIAQKVNGLYHHFSEAEADGNKYKNDGAGSFGSSFSNAGAMSDVTRSFAFGDGDGDGDLDLANVFASTAARLLELTAHHFEEKAAVLRYRKFISYFAANFRYGHTLYKGVQNCSTVVELRAALHGFFATAPELASTPNMNYLQ